MSSMDEPAAGRGGLPEDGRAGVARFAPTAVASPASHSSDAVNGFRGVYGVERGEDEVARLGGLERYLGRLVVAHLADEYDFGCLPQRRPEGRREVFGVRADLALVDGRVLVRVQKLNRVFDGDDVVVVLLVDEVNDGGERRRLTRTRRARDEPDAVAQVR